MNYGGVETKELQPSKFTGEQTPVRTAMNSLVSKDKIRSAKPNPRKISVEVRIVYLTINDTDKP